MSLRFTFLSILLIVVFKTSSAQSVTNGTFASSGTGWGCAPEASNFETTYGGSVGTNRVAETDNAAGLCQTITGFVIGSLYSVSIDCSRRTGGCPSPNPTPMLVTITGGGTPLSTTISRSNATFALTTSTSTFTATATSQTLTLAKGAGFGTGTCGMIVDNIVITLVSALPVELVNFSANLNVDKVDLAWTTSSETNNDFFTIQKSRDAQNFEDLFQVDGAGQSTSHISYFDIDRNPFVGISYYRLKQTDFNGNKSYSNIVPVEYHPNGEASINLFPNPSNESGTSYLELNQFGEQEVLVVLRDVLGKELYTKVLITKSNNELVAINQDGNLPIGTYLITASSNNKIYSKRLIVK